MNLREGNGLVPIRNFNTGSNAPYVLVEFPNPVVFNSLWGNRIKQEAKNKFHAILQARLNGATLQEAGQPFGIQRERVRQIEAKFLRLLAEQYSHLPTPSSTTEKT